MPFRFSKKHREILSDDMISAEYGELDAALDTRAAAEAAQAAAKAALQEPAAQAVMQEPAAQEAMQESADDASAASAAAPQTTASPVNIQPEIPAEPEAVPAPAEAEPEPAAEGPESDAGQEESEGQEELSDGDNPPQSVKKPGKKEKAKKSEKKEKKKDENRADPKKKRKKPKRKGRYITPLIILGILIGMAAACMWNIWYCKHNFEVNFYSVESTHVSSDVRIVVISDVHLSEYGEDNMELVSAVRALEPDLIISAGDLVTYGVKNYDNMLSLCRQLAAIAPFYGVMGNHEDEKTYLEHDEELRQRFKDTGMILLVNKCETLKIRNNDVELVGVSGGTEGFDLYGGEDTMEKLKENSTAMRICVAHVPTLFRDRLENYDFDIGIAGHTHGGVVRVPMIGGLYSAEEGFRPEYDGGLYDLENGATLFVSRGLGNSGKIPRFNNTPELAVLDVRWY